MRDSSPLTSIIAELAWMARGPGVNVGDKEMLLIMKRCVHASNYFQLGDLQYEKSDVRVRRILHSDISTLTAPRLREPILFESIVLVGFNIGQDAEMAEKDLTERFNEFTERGNGILSRRTVARDWDHAKQGLAKKIYRDLTKRGLIN